jgi:hypothetical protein
VREESKRAAFGEEPDMPASAPYLLRAALTVAIAAALTGCQYRYDANGDKIYRWQFGQDNLREIDYSNPRLPILPKWRPNTDLWPLPSPYQFNDLSKYSFLNDPYLLNPAPIRVSDNAACAACSESTARLALLATRADDLDRRSSRTAR